VIGHLLNRRLSVLRPSTVPDGSGGQWATYTLVGEIAAKVDQPTARERAEGDQWGAEHSHTVYFRPGADVRRGDELHGGGQRFRVLATAAPSRSAYLKAPASELVQAEGE
jgi:head-tail adaptor